MREFISTLRRNNIHLKLVEGELSVKVPKGAKVDKDLLEEIRTRKPDLINYLTLLNKYSFSSIRAAKDQGDFPLSSSQRRLWVMSQLGEGNAAYNIPGVFAFEGTLDRPAMEYSFATLILRHETLRTVFRENDKGEIRQFVLPAEETESGIAFHDLRGEEAGEVLVKTLVQQENVRPFDLGKGPLVRAGLYQLSSDKWVFHYVMHHIISDGWSMDILIMELLQLYNASVKGERNPLAPLNIQYKDYASWQQEQLDREESKAHRNYWLQQFEGTLPVLELNDKPRPAVKTFKGASVKEIINEQVSRDIKALSQEQGATLFMGLLAAVAALLYRYTGQEDIIIGTPVAGRDHADLEDQIGFYANTLALRIRFSGDQSFRQLLAHTREVTFGAHEHQVYPFDELVGALQIRRDLSRNPLFDVQVVLSHYENQDKEYGLEGLKVSGFDWDELQTSRFDMVFSFSETPAGLQLTVQYNTDLYTEESVKRLSAHLKQLLVSIIALPDLSLSQFDFLSEREKRQLLKDFNNTAEDFPRDKTIVTLFEEQAAKNPDHTAIVFGKQTLSYGELNKQADRLAHYLRNTCNAGAEDLVGIMLDRTEKMMIAVLGVLKSGAAYVPIDPDYPKDRKEYIVQDTGIKALITETAYFFDSLDYFRGNVFAIDVQMDTLEEPERLSTSFIRPDSLAYVIYTSGSTGRPKGVMIEHHSLVDLSLWQKKYFELDESKKISQMGSFSFDASVGESVMALTNGCTLVMIPKDEFINLIELINHHGIDVVVTVPSMLKQLSPENLTGNPRIVSVGEKCSVELYERWKDHCHFINGYGPTEYTVYSHVWHGRDKMDSIPIGKSRINLKTYIAGAQMKPCPIGVNGEIYLSGPGTGRGYFNNRKRTFESFLPNHFFLDTVYRDRGEVADPEAAHRQESAREISFMLQKVTTEINEKLTCEDLVAEIRKQFTGSLSNEAIRILKENSNDAEFKKAFLRYYYEGMFNTYKTEGISWSVFRELMGGDVSSSVKGVDFGCGSGELVQTLRSNGITDITGIDVSPYFIAGLQDKGINGILSRIDTPVDVFLEKTGIEAGSMDFAISTLTLDRVQHPHNLLKNMSAVLKEGGRLIVGTLLPIIEHEDGENQSDFAYTRYENKLAPGVKVDEDKYYVLESLIRSGITNLELFRVRTQVISKNGVQDYELFVFCGNRKKREPAALDYIRMYKTGDMGRWLADGNIEFSGRRDEQVKIRGIRIEPGEMETALQAYPGIESAVVVAKGADDNVQMIAYIVSSIQLPVADIRDYLGTVLPVYMVPNHFVQLERLPLTHNGKIDRKQLPHPDGVGMQALVEYVEPRNETEEKLHQLWQEILGREKISMKDNFFDLGGHSLKATRLASQVHKLFDVKITLNELFALPVLEEQAQFISQAARTSFTTIEPLEPREDYALSSSQRRLWILDQLDNGNAAYNIQGVYVFEGELDYDAFAASLDGLVERHESLRTTFSENSGGEVRQVIHSPEDAGVRIEYMDFRDNEDREENVRSLFRRQSVEPFDLAAGPLLRASLCRMEENKWVFGYVMHHIISDGWSMNILIKELLKLYNAHTNEEANPLTPLRIQYKDYAAWQQQQLSGESLEAHKDYWLKQFEGDLPVLELSSGKPVPAVKTYNGKHVSLRLNETLSQGLKTLSQQQGGTLFMGILAAVNALLYRYTAQEDIIIGTPIAGREHADLEGQIGFYLNTLALRSRFSGQDNFQQLLERVKQTTLDAYEHQVYPFDELVEALNLPRDLSRSALFDVMVVLQNQQEAETLQFGNLQVSGYEGAESRFSKFNLTFNFREEGAELQMLLTYNCDIFEQTAMEQLTHHLEQLISSIIREPHTPIQQLDYLGEEEKRQLLMQFNRTTTDYPKDKTIVHLFEEQAARTPDVPAVIFGDESLTYKQLNEGANRLAHYLVTHYAIAPDDLIAIKLERSEQMIVTLLGVLKSGGAYIPVDLEYPQERVNYMLEDSSCKLVIDAELLESFGKEQEQYSSANLTPHNLTPSNLAYVIYTSGSTGRPKGVMIEHRSLVDYCYGLFARTNIRECKTFGLVSTIAADLGNTVLFPSLISGGTLHIFSGVDVTNPVTMLAANLDCIKIVPSHWKILQLNGRVLAPNRMLVFGGEQLTADVLHLLKKNNAGCRVFNHYGPSETTVGKLLCPVDIHEEHTRIPLGSPFCNSGIYILDNQYKLLPAGITGEICISGDGLARGYLNKPELTNERFITVELPFIGNTRIYKTGDLGRWLPDGSIEFIGRRDDQVKIRGYRVELSEIESTLRSIKAIDAAVLAAPVDSRGDRELVAYIVAKEELTAADIRSALAQSLPAFMIPTRFVLLEQLPLTANGKVDRKRLPHHEGAGLGTGTEYVAPRNEVEEELVLIWEEVLDRERIGVKDSFFDLGGHSLKVMQMISRINMAFQVRINVRNVFSEPSIENLSRHITFLLSQKEQKQNKEALTEFEI